MMRPLLPFGQQALRAGMFGRPHRPHRWQRIKGQRNLAATTKQMIALHQRLDGALAIVTGRARDDLQRWLPARRWPGAFGLFRAGFGTSALLFLRDQRRRFRWWLLDQGPASPDRAIGPGQGAARSRTCAQDATGYPRGSSSFARIHQK